MEVVCGPRTRAIEAQVRELEEHGLVVAFELFGDGRVLVDLAVGAQLSQDEQRGAGWHPPQLAALSLPSGKLCIDTPDSRRLDSPEDTGGEPTIVTEVPKGDYTVSLHRADWQDIPDDHPFYFVALTNLPPPAERQAYLAIADIGGGLAWLKHWALGAGAVFQGLARRTPATCDLVTNLDATTAETALGLHFGSRLSIEIGGKTYGATFIHCWRRQTLRLFGASMFDQFVSPLEASYGTTHTGTTKVVELSPWAAEATELRTLGDESVPVRIAVLPNPVLPPLDPALAAGWTAHGVTLEGRVILASDAAVLLNVPWTAITGIARWDDSLVLTMGGTTRRVHLDTADSKKAIQKAREAAESAMPGAAALKKNIAAVEKKQIAAADEDMSVLFSGPLFEERQRLEAERAAFVPPPDIAARFPLIARPLSGIASDDMLIALQPILGERNELDATVGSVVRLKKA
jgi:hypothetical protein